MRKTASGSIATGARSDRGDGRRSRYPSIGSRAGHVGLFSPLMDRRDLLLVDNRGTGGSHVIDCEQIQTSAFLFLQGAAECGDLLGKTCDPVPCKRVYHDTFYINSAADDMRAGMAKLERLLLGSETLLADNEVATETLDPNLL